MRRSTLQRKDRDELTQIAETLGGAPPSRARKGEIIELIMDLVSDGNGAAGAAGQAAGTTTASTDAAGSESSAGSASAAADAETAQGAEAGTRRRRRRGRERENKDNGNDSFDGEPMAVQGHLDLRNEGYGFLRVEGYLACRDDVYVPVKLVRRHGLRKGDLVAGQARPAGRSEKNPALLSVASVNGADPEAAAERPRFDELTPVFATEQLVMEQPPGTEAADALLARAIDLLAPIGKGQRGLIVAPPRAGKTTFVKQIVRSLETNSPALAVMVLLIDGRPEEITEMSRWAGRAEVVASGFGKPAEEHVSLAEMTIERAKRMAESGADVCVLIDSLSSLSRACAAEGAQAGRAAKAAGISAAAIQPAKKLFSAARNLEEAGSVTVVATLSVGTGSPTDELIADEFRHAATMELRLDAEAAARRIFPAIDLAASSTVNAELLVGAGRLDEVHSLRRHLAAMHSEGSSAAPLGMLVANLESFATNEELLAGVPNQPGDS